MDLKTNIDKFIEGIKPNSRDASFDYCFNYFQNFREDNRIEKLADSDNIQLSCLQLGFFLASWGMFRNRLLLNSSIKYYTKLISEISKFNKKIWSIDVPDYEEKNIELLLECKKMIIASLGKASDTLVTKIMLGIFGNTPAFDQYFSKIFGSVLNKKSLKNIYHFYQDNKSLIDGYKINTIDFLTGEKTVRMYTKAKIIDMAGWMGGYNETENKISKSLK